MRHALRVPSDLVLRYGDDQNCYDIMIRTDQYDSILNGDTYSPDLVTCLRCTRLAGENLILI